VRNRSPAPAVDQPMFRLLAVLAVSLLVLPPAPAHAAELDEFMKSVEEIRGLPFKGEVKSVTIDRSELPGRLRDQLTRTLPYSIDQWAEILEALLLIEGEREGAFDELLSLYESQVLAYYDPDTRTFYALSQPPPAMEGLPEGFSAKEGVIVHELVHALQDQHQGIGRRALDLRRDTDASLAYHAILEGEATLVMLAYLLEKNGLDFDTVVRQPVFDGLMGSATSAEFMFDDSSPRYFVESLKFPYLDGLRFVLHAYRRGGWAELDRVYANPPGSTREILHPEIYFERRFKAEPFKPVPSLPVDYLTVEHLGQFHWNFLLGAENARGWKSDRVTIAQDVFCDKTVLVETTWDSAEEAQRFLRAYMNLLDGRGIGFLSSRDGSRVRLAYGADRSVMERFLR
jgi:hypothetical protein